NRTLNGKTCAILGFGGIGVSTARLMRGIGMRVHAINRRGASEEPVDWIGTPDQLGTMLAAADVPVIAAPLTRRTIGSIGDAGLRHALANINRALAGETPHHLIGADERML